MYRGTNILWAKNFRLSLKYPSLVSYNKLPWEIVNHESVLLHQHVAPYYKQILTLAGRAPVPNLVVPKHLDIPVAQRLRVLPGKLYILSGPVKVPNEFSSHQVLDSSALQFYGGVHRVAPVKKVEMLISDDLKLLCLAVSFDNTTAVTPKSALDGVGNNPSDGFCLYHYFRPNRPVNELTRPLDRFYVHRPTSSVLDDLLSQQWTPKLNPPTRDKSKKVSPLPAYNPPQSYLMGLAERLAVIPGNSFGRRSLMWGHWF